MPARRTLVVGAAVAVLLVGSVGCGDDDPDVSETGAPPPASTTTIAPSTGPPSAALVAGLVEGVHLLGDRTAAVVAGRADEVTAVDTAIDTNVTALAAAVGDSGPFGTAWSAMVDQLRAYTTAATAQDHDGMDAARLQLNDLATDPAFEGDVGPNLTDDVDDYVTGAVEAIDATVAGDAPTAHEQLIANGEQVETLAENMAATGLGATPVAAPASASAVATTTTLTAGGSDEGSQDPMVDLVAELAEHPLVAGAVTDAIVQGRQADVPAATIELEANTKAIVERVRADFPEDADGFEALWRQHLDAYQAYATGAAGGDTAAMAAARVPLGQFVDGVADMIERWTGGQMTAADARGELTMHVDGTLAVIDAQARNDLPTGYQLADQGVTAFAAFAEQLGPLLQPTAASGDDAG